MKSKKLLSAFWVSITLIAMVPGCTSFKVIGKPKSKARPALTEGMILVGRPEVFSFSRLIEQRQKDIELLEKKLNAYDPDRFQVMREVRVFESISEPAGVTVEPDKANVQLEASSPQQKAEPSSASSENEPHAQQGTPPGLPSAPQARAVAVKDPERKLPLADQLVKTKAQQSSYDQVLDEIVYRNMINSELRSLRQDDSLSLMGFTIYSFNFKVSVIPGNNTYTLGEAALNMIADQEISEVFFRRWQRELQADLVEEAFSVQSRWNSGDLSDREKLALQQSASQLQHQLQENVGTLEREVRDLKRNMLALNQEQKEKSANIVSLEKEIEKIEADLEIVPKKAMTLLTRNNLKAKKDVAEKRIHTLRQRIAEIDAILNENKRQQEHQEARIFNLKGKIANNDRFASDLAAAHAGSLVGNQIVLCDIIRDKYVRNLKGLVSFLAHSHVNIDGKKVYFPQLDLNPDEKTEASQFELFKKRLQGLNLQPYIHAVEPRQYVQNISETTARNEITPDQRNSLIMQHGITRKPLAVGYVRGTKEFGWILGPRQEVEVGGEPSVRHLPVQYNFQVQLTVPAWFESIKLVGKYFWLNEDGSVGKGADIWDGEIEVKLPGQPKGITSALIKDSAIQHRPVILPPWDSGDDEDRFYFREGEKATMMIRGYDLWRHPQVYLGTQRASSVEIMPDLGGLIITFDRIETSQPRYGQYLLNLVVVTSRGKAILTNAVEILPPVGQEQ